MAIRGAGFIPHTSRCRCVNCAHSPQSHSLSMFLGIHELVAFLQRELF